MPITRPRPPQKYRGVTIPVLLLVGASMVLAACGSSNKSSTNGTGSTAPTTAASSSTTSGASDAAITVKVANVAGLGNVLVNGNGRTLYVLEGEQGGRVTCTKSGDCTKVWPPVVLPSGVAHGVAGNGVQASLLGTVNGPSGDVRLTYAGWPLYTFENDTGPGQIAGQGVNDVYGIWWVISPSGTPNKTSTSSSSTSAPATTAPASGGAGF